MKITLDIVSDSNRATKFSLAIVDGARSFAQHHCKQNERIQMFMLPPPASAQAVLVVERETLGLDKTWQVVGFIRSEREQEDG